MRVAILSPETVNVYRWNATFFIFSFHVVALDAALTEREPEPEDKLFLAKGRYIHMAKCILQHL